MTSSNWWERRWFLAVVVIAAAAPLFLPEVPQLVDLPGHLARYRVQLDLGHSADLQRYYDYQWALVGNLGFDLLIVPMAALFGLELAAKLLVIATVMITATAMLWIAREAHGRIPPTAFFAIPLIYSFPFNYGFLNYSLSIGLSLLAFGLWLHLTKRGEFRVRLLLFLPIGCVVWLAHAMGWAVLCLLAGSSEAQRLWALRSGWRRGLVDLTRALAALAAPLVLMLVWRSGAVGGATSGFFDTKIKWLSLVSVLRDRWPQWDMIGLIVILLLIVVAVASTRWRMAADLRAPGVALVLLFLLMPFTALGAAYADTRLVPIALILLVLSIDVGRSDPTGVGLIGGLAVAFMGVRLIGNGLSFAIADREAKVELAALDHVPKGASVLSVVGGRCVSDWPMPRHLHLNSFVTVRRDGFTNGHWQLAGAQLIRVTYDNAGPFVNTESSGVFPERCIPLLERFEGKQKARWRRLGYALEQFPRDGFSYVWVIEPPHDWDGRYPSDLRPIWRGGRSILFKVEAPAT